MCSTPSRTGTDRRTIGGAAWVLWLAAALLCARPAQAHQQDERRDLVLILAPGQVQLLIAYVLPPGRQAAEARAMIDADRSGAIDHPQEELARATLLTPRLVAGLSLAIDGHPIDLTLENLAWREGPGDSGPRQGLTGLALYTAPTALAVGSSAEVVLSIEEGAMATGAEVQLEPGIEAGDTLLPRQPDAPILGPVDLSPQLPLQLTFRVTELPAPPTPG